MFLYYNRVENAGIKVLSLRFFPELLDQIEGVTIPLLSILLVNYNGLAHLHECMSSIHDQSFQDFEVVMVDNASKDGSVEFIRRNFPQVNIIISESNLGFAGGNNLGFRHCQGDYVFFLNNDTRLHHQAFESLGDAIRRHSGIHVFACFLIDFYNLEKVDSAGDTIYTAGIPFSFTGFPVSRFTEERVVTAACAGAAAYSRKLLERLEGFDEDFFLNLEDLDLSLRARHLGEQILFLPSVKVYHKGSASMGGKRSAISFYYVERNLLWFFIKNYPFPSLLNTLKYYPFLKTLRFFHAVRFGLVRIYFRATWDSLMKIPVMYGKRRAILKGSRITPEEFGLHLRPHWLKERIVIFRGRTEKISP